MHAYRGPKTSDIFNDYRRIVSVKWIFFHAWFGLLGNRSASPEIPS